MVYNSNDSFRHRSNIIDRRFGSVAAEQQAVLEIIVNQSTHEVITIPMQYWDFGMVSESSRIKGK